MIRYAHKVLLYQNASYITYCINVIFITIFNIKYFKKK